MSTVRRSSRGGLAREAEAAVGDAQHPRPVQPGRQVAERRVAQAHVGVDEGRRARRAARPARRARRRSRPAPAAASAPTPRRPGASAPARDARGCPARAPAPAPARCGCRGRAPARSWRDRRARRSPRCSRSPSRPAPRRARAGRPARGSAMLARLLAQLGRRSKRVVELLAQVARPAGPVDAARTRAPTARIRSPGTAARSANSCGTFVAWKLVTRVPSTATRVCGRGAPARASSSMSIAGGRHQQELAARHRRVERLEEETIDEEPGRERGRRRARLQVLPFDEVADRDVGRRDRLLAGDLLGLARRPVALVRAQRSGSRRRPGPRSPPTCRRRPCCRRGRSGASTSSPCRPGRSASPRDRAP